MLYSRVVVCTAIDQRVVFQRLNNEHRDDRSLVTLGYHVSFRALQTWYTIFLDIGHGTQKQPREDLGSTMVARSRVLYLCDGEADIPKRRDGLVEWIS